AGLAEVEPLGALALHLQRDLLDVEHDVGDVLAHAGERAELVQHVLDPDRGDRRTLKAGQEHPAQRVAERQAVAPLERLGHESRLALLVATGLDVERVGLLQFLPVLRIDGHGLPLKVSLNGTAAERWVRRGRCETWRPMGPPAGSIRRGGAWMASRRCAGSG